MRLVFKQNALYMMKATVKCDHTKGKIFRYMNLALTMAGHLNRNPDLLWFSIGVVCAFADNNHF